MSGAQLVSRVRPFGHVTLALTGVVIGAVWWVIGDVPAGHGSALAFVIGVAVGELIVLDEPRARPVPASIAVVAAFALLGNGPLVTTAVAVAGWVLGAAARALLGQGPVRAWDLVVRAVDGWAMPSLVALSALAAPGLAVSAANAPGEGLHVVGFLAVSAAIVLGLPLWDAVDDASFAGGVTGPMYIARFRRTFLAGIALAAGAGLTTLVHGELGGWALLLTLLPLLAARSGLLRLAGVRRTHEQTIRAMSRLPEFIRAAPSGHAERVSTTAVAMGHDLGLTASEIDVLERAALLHEIGAVIGSGQDTDAAHASADVVRQVRHLASVADIIEHHRDERGIGLMLAGQRVPLPARILRAACDYDRLIAGTELDPGSWEAVRHFHLSAGHRHEPGIVQALARSIDRSLVV